jgi:hypothetical protein
LIASMQNNFVALLKQKLRGHSAQSVR